MIESFWARMQVELLNRRRWSTRVELANAIFEYIEGFHNRRRRHGSLGWDTPLEFEKNTNNRPRLLSYNFGKPGQASVTQRRDPYRVLTWRTGCASMMASMASPGSDQDLVRVLVVDDEPHLRHLLSTALKRQGWTVEAVATGAAALERAHQWRPHLIVLDIVLPDIDGMHVLQALRDESSEAMVLFLTANSGLPDRIAGISAGGDDYVTKPFSLEEVVVRLRGLLRRSPLLGVPPTPVLQVGDLILNEDSHQVTRAGEDIRLTATEFSLLRFLMDNANIVLTKEQILSRVWEYDFGRESNIVELYISYLRKKIDAGRAPMLHTLRLVGYVLRPAEAASAEEG